NSAGERWWAWVVTTSVETAVLLALFALAWLAIRNRVVPQVGYCLFLLIPIKLLVPFEMAIPAAVANWTPSAIASSFFQRGRDATAFETPRQLHLPVVIAAGEQSAPIEPPRPPAGFIRADSNRGIRPAMANSSAAVAPSGRSLAGSATESASLSFKAIAMLAW